MAATGYTRQSSANIQAGLAIQSADVNNEFNQLQSAFDNTTGHDHSGSATGTGSKIDLTAAVTGILPLANGGVGRSLALTGGASRVLMQTSVGANITVANLAASDLNNGTTGTGAVMLAANPTSTGTLTAGNITLAGILSASAVTTTSTISATATITGNILNASNNSVQLNGASVLERDDTFTYIYNPHHALSIQVGTTGTSTYFADNHNMKTSAGVNFSAVNAASFNVSSDIKLKENIKDLPPLDLSQLRPVTFNYIGSDKVQYGLIAQEVQQTDFQNLVVENDQIETLILNYIGLIAPIIKTLQDMEKRLAALEKKA